MEVRHLKVGLIKVPHHSHIKMLGLVPTYVGPVVPCRYSLVVGYRRLY